MTDISISNVTVRFLRRIQPAQFEPAEAEVTLTASSPEGGTISQEQTDGLILQAKMTVNSALGIANKGSKAAEPAKVAEAKPADAKKPAATTEQKPAETKKGPGRPPGTTKKVEPAKPAAEAPAGETDEFGQPIAAEGEAPAAAEDATDEFGEAAAPAKLVTIGELQGEVTALIKAKRITVDAVKEVYGEYGQARSADLTPEQYAPALAKILAKAKPAA